MRLEVVRTRRGRVGASVSSVLVSRFMIGIFGDRTEDWAFIRPRNAMVMVVRGKNRKAQAKCALFAAVHRKPEVTE